MSFQTLLVHVEPDELPDPRLALAVSLANLFNAELIGIGAEAYGTSGLVGGYGPEYGGAEIYANLAANVDANLALAEKKFQAVADSVRQGTQWRAAVQYPADKIAAEARAADLIITSHYARAAASNYTAAAPGTLIMQTGRPVLVAPPGAEKLAVANIVVAWKETREARRAVSDALPLLRNAHSVLLVEISNSTGSAPAARHRLEDVRAHLRRHNVESGVMVVAEARIGSAADQLLDIAEQQRADLIVAGGYGHSRLREWAFGGFTQALLSQTRHAVLFSH
jgi:nucleotide-binding universal stress UspA family protein